MQLLNLPPIDHKVKNIADKAYIFDPIRRKYVVLTPEEWVRQHLVGLLLRELGYPRPLVKVESGLRYNRMARRTDVVVFDRNGKHFLLAECKAPGEKISQKTFEQITVYNKTLQAPVLVLTNGMELYCCQVDTEKGESCFLKTIPACTW